jgi:hypothetical protein
VKLLRIESGQRQKIYLEDLAELALALDVSPLQLIVPHGDEAQQVHVTVGGEVDRTASDVKQWFRGVKPLLPRIQYPTDEDATSGHRFYLIDSQSLGEWGLIAESGKYASRIQRSLEVLEESTSGE